MRTKLSFLILLLACVLAVAGCGGGGGSKSLTQNSAATSTGGRGSVKITITWPARTKAARSRVIPAPTERVTVVATLGGKVLETETAYRPTNGQLTSTIQFGAVDAGNVLFTATAYSNFPYTSTLAVGTATVPITANQIANATITLTAIDTTRVRAFNAMLNVPVPGNIDVVQNGLNIYSDTSFNTNPPLYYGNLSGANYSSGQIYGYFPAGSNVQVKATAYPLTLTSTTSVTESKDAFYTLVSAGVYGDTGPNGGQVFQFADNFPTVDAGSIAIRIINVQPNSNPLYVGVTLAGGPPPPPGGVFPPVTDRASYGSASPYMIVPYGNYSTVISDGTVQNIDQNFTYIAGHIYTVFVYPSSQSAPGGVPANYTFRVYQDDEPSPPPGQNPTLAYVNGRVVDNTPAANGVPNATISVVGTSITVKTNVDGTFTLSNVPLAATQFTVLSPNTAQWFNVANYLGKQYDTVNCKLPLPNLQAGANNLFGTVVLFSTNEPPPPPPVGGCP